MKPTTTRILSIPLSGWSENLRRSRADKQEMEGDLAFFIQRAALLHAYISFRYNTGCGVKTHQESAEHANTELKKIRKAMGFSYPDKLPFQL